VCIIIYFISCGDIAFPTHTTSLAVHISFTVKSQKDVKVIVNSLSSRCHVGFGFDLILHDFTTDNFYSRRTKDDNNGYTIYAVATIKIINFQSIKGITFNGKVDRAILRRCFDDIIKKKLGKKTSFNWNGSPFDGFDPIIIDWITR
jgi:hypothetical protein